MMISTAAMALLHDLSKATSQGGFLYQERDQILSELIIAGFAVCNASMSDQEGRVATRSTPQGDAVLARPEARPAVPVAAPAEDDDSDDSYEYVIEEYTTVAEVVGRGVGLKPRQSAYPFQKLNIGQRFFIPATKGKDGKITKHHSLCAGQSQIVRKAYDDAVAYNFNNPHAPIPLPVQRKFVCRAVTAGQVLDAGLSTQVTVKADGEYVFCIAGLADKPTPKEKSAE